MNPILRADPRRAIALLPQYSFIESDYIESDYYEPIEAYTPDKTFECIVRSAIPFHWRMIRNGIWHQAMPPRFSLPVQGWKIHVSATLTNVEDVLKIATDRCVTHQAVFKFLCDRQLLMLANSKNWPRGAAGKFMAIYPESEEQFIHIVDDLYTHLKDFEGPYILSDRRYSDCKVLYYRYGGFERLDTLFPDGLAQMNIVSPDGLRVPDSRDAAFEPPHWIRDPFASEEEEETDFFLKAGRYRVEESIVFTNVGGVYIGRDRDQNRKVVIKEARPNTGFDLDGNSATSLREKEWRILTQLRTATVAPAPVDLFCDWEHVFLEAVMHLVDWCHGNFSTPHTVPIRCHR